MCDQNTYMMGMDAKVEGKKAADDTAMGGSRIICDSLVEEDMLNSHEADSKYGKWVNGRKDLLETVEKKILFCGGEARFEGKQGYFGDDSALNGIRIGKCDQFIKTLTGSWELVLT